MLILTRRPVETIYIGDDVTVTVLGVIGNQVRFGINAPRHIAVHREEIYKRIKREQQGGSPSAEVEVNGNVAEPEPPAPEEEKQPLRNDNRTLSLKRVRRA